MRHITNILAILFVLSSLCVAQQDTLTILFVSDTHSSLAPAGPRSVDLQGTIGGIARAAALINSTKNTEPNVLTLHGGDMFMGSIFFNMYFGIEEMKLMGAIGFDVLTLGNHEFDLGPLVLQRALQSALRENPMTIVSSNIEFPEDDKIRLQKYILPYTIKQFGSTKVGIFGLTTPETNALSSPSPVCFNENCCECAAKTIQILKENGCTYIICLSHIGYAHDIMMASNLNGVDLIISAHDHSSKEIIGYANPSGRIAWVSQTDAFYTEMGMIQMLVSGQTTELLSADHIPLDKKIKEDLTIKTLVDNMIARIELQFGPMFTKQIGTTTETFDEVQNDVTSIGSKETAVGNLVTDAFRAYTMTDIAIEPGGSTAQPIFKGPIIGDDLFRAIGYGFNENNNLGFRLVTCTITGQSLLNALEKCLEYSQVNDEFYPQVSGMTFSSRRVTEEGSRVKWVFVHGEALDPEKIYSVTTNELALNLLTSMFGITVSDVVVDQVTEYEALSAYVEARGTISPAERFSPGVKDKGPMLHAEKVTSMQGNGIAAVIPDKFSLGQNYPNPFNPSTTIRYALPASSQVKLVVFDLLGREIATLVNEEQSSGWKEVIWNAGNISSGIYFYKLTAGTFVEMKKMSLMK